MFYQRYQGLILAMEGILINQGNDITGSLRHLVQIPVGRRYQFSKENNGQEGVSTKLAPSSVSRCTRLQAPLSSIFRVLKTSLKTRRANIFRISEGFQFPILPNSLFSPNFSRDQFRKFDSMSYDYYTCNYCATCTKELFETLFSTPSTCELFCRVTFR